MISNDAYQHTSEDMLVVAVTSNLRKSRFTVDLEQRHMAEGILPSIRADKVYALAQNIVIKKMGQVTPDRLDQVRARS